MTQPEHGAIYCGDCLEIMRTWPEACVDCVVTDPPYGLSFMGKKWDYDVPSTELWREVFRVHKDGGRCFAFSGSRTYHRMAVNIEDAGFTIEDSVIWLYGSGFPKHKSKLKPAHEPICVARKGKVTPLEIDAGRIATNDDLTHDGGGIGRLNSRLHEQGYAGIDLDPEYCEIARARLKHWKNAAQQEIFT